VKGRFFGGDPIPFVPFPLDKGERESVKGKGIIKRGVSPLLDTSLGDGYEIK